MKPKPRDTLIWDIDLKIWKSERDLELLGYEIWKSERDLEILGYESETLLL